MRHPERRAQKSARRKHTDLFDPHAPLEKQPGRRRRPTAIGRNRNILDRRSFFFSFFVCAHLPLPPRLSITVFWRKGRKTNSFPYKWSEGSQHRGLAGIANISSLLGEARAITSPPLSRLFRSPSPFLTSSLSPVSARRPPRPTRASVDPPYRHPSFGLFQKSDTNEMLC